MNPHADAVIVERAMSLATQAGPSASLRSAAGFARRSPEDDAFAKR